VIWTVFLVAITLLIAYANGANDNFKGVATLFGSGTTHYQKALHWATLATFLGSLTAFFLATKLIKTFSGKGLVPEFVTQDPVFMSAVILGAGITVLVAARAGIPISTTHSLVGALVGSGLMAIGGELHFKALQKSFLLPLLASPFIAIGVTALIYFFSHWVKSVTKVKSATCLCVGERRIPVGHLGVGPGGTLSASQLITLDVFVDEQEACQMKAVETYSGRVFGIGLQQALDFLHFLSAGAVSFARGLNDTPKIVALAIAGGVLGLHVNIAAVAIAMALGGLISTRRVAETVSHRITPMTHGQGLTANLITASLVIFASHLGMPVSTTHVSCSSLFGIGLVTKKARWNVIRGIVTAWVLTLPVAALVAAISYGVLRLLGVS
jgi:inorganic phosphate transporter, PiT family